MSTIPPLLIDLVLLICGLALGLYAPATLLYLVEFLRGTEIGVRVVGRAALRLLAILFIYAVLFAGLGLLMTYLGNAAKREIAWLGGGGLLGLGGGLALLFIAIVKGRHHARTANMRHVIGGSS